MPSEDTKNIRTLEVPPPHGANAIKGYAAGEEEPQEKAVPAGKHPTAEHPPKMSREEGQGA